MSHYYLTIVEIETGKTVYENGFINRHNVAEELEDWDLDEYCYSIEEITVPDFA